VNRRINALVTGIILVVCSVAAAEFPTSQPFDGVTYRAETRTEPPMRLFIAEVDVTNPRVHVRVAPGGPDPDGAGPWETTLMPPTRIATRESFDLVVNGDFFDARNIKDAEGEESQYRSDIWGEAKGPAVSNGKTWSTSSKKLPCLVVYKNRKVTIEDVDKPAADAWAVISGNTMLVADGKVIPHENKKKHPRTVVGLDKKGTKLTILVVDGRKPGVSIGMSYDELAQEMVRLGCWRAVNLDGGGSTVMAFRDPSNNEYKIVNTPTDGRERAVVNALGIMVDKKASTKSNTTNKAK
jgi:hypothetical protein